jgi:deoxycytidine triphosphate deaminase
MLLNIEEIKRLGLLTRTKDENFKGGATYNLTIGEIISLDGKKYNEYSLPPRGMVLIVSNEQFNLPSDIIGYTTVKNSLSSDGIMAINIGIVDPGWKKPISSLMVNFGATPQLILKEQSFLRMTFHKFNKMSTAQTYPQNEVEPDYLYHKYVNTLREKSIKKLSSTFLSIESIKKDISSEVWKRFGKSLVKISIYIAIISGLIGIISFAITQTKNAKQYLTQTGNQAFVTKLDSLTVRLNELEKGLDNLQGAPIKQHDDQKSKIIKGPSLKYE